MAISFLCFSKSWDNMDVAHKKTALTNENFESRLMGSS